MKSSSPADATNLSKSSNASLFVNASSGLSLREGTNLRSNKILTLPYGSEVIKISTPANTKMTVEGITGNMVEVSYQGAKGFAFDGYLSPIAPPKAEETLKNYASRISTDSQKIVVVKTPHKKGDTYGMLTEVILPATNWGEIYKITKMLFNLPKNINPNLSQAESNIKIVNSRKRERTLIDELTIHTDDSKEITSVEYEYVLKNYSRSVRIIKVINGYKIIENESSI